MKVIKNELTIDLNIEDLNPDNWKTKQKYNKQDELTGYEQIENYFFRLQNVIGNYDVLIKPYLVALNSIIKEKKVLLVQLKETNEHLNVAKEAYKKMFEKLPKDGKFPIRIISKDPITRGEIKAKYLELTNRIKEMAEEHIGVAEDLKDLMNGVEIDELIKRRNEKNEKRAKAITATKKW